MFLPIPAIDLMDGRVVRLSRGEAAARTVYSEDPVGVARDFEAAGARRLHVVDLEGAFGGRPANLPVIERIRAAVTMKVEVGGGLRTRADVERVLGLGADFAILGTGALRDPALTAELAGAFGARLIVGIDARDGKVAVEGWVETSDQDAVEFARQMEGLGVGTVIFTDIATDGMMTGPSLTSLARLCDAVGLDVIASGGVRNVDDLLALKNLNKKNLIGAITGRAVYEKTLDLAESIRRLG